MTALTTDYLSSLGLTGYNTTTSASETSSTDSATGSNNELGQSDFLKLMITQLTNQDPTNPVENEDFASQMAQFSTLTGIEELTSSFEKLSQTLLQGQTVEAATLVGQGVLVPASTAELSEGQGTSGAVDLTASASQVSVNIQDTSGQLVRTLNLGTQSAGLIDFEWDGLLENGSAAPAGTYSFNVAAQRSGQTEALETLLDGQVKSVSLDSGTGALMLNVQGVGSVGFSSVKRVGQ
jgi:flagellar basal-body rod modification protein FlgD